MNPLSTVVRDWLGVISKDLPRFVPSLLMPSGDYLGLCNRHEDLGRAPDSSGYQCRWHWTSDLHAPTVWPRLGLTLMKRALNDHPVRLAYRPSQLGEPEVSFVIGHRGAARLPLLLKTLESIAGQRAVTVECVVIEHDVESRIAGALPSWVKHVFVPTPVADLPYCRSWTMNAGARLASGELLILHDNDIVVSEDYAHLSWQRFRNGFDVVDLKRFGFYLTESHTRGVLDGTESFSELPPDTVRQNQTAGASIAIGRDAFFRIGGMDEGFVGWGGEDNEFWERALTQSVWPFGCLPVVHLWHPAQPGKYDNRNPTLARHRQLAAVDPVQRIERLRAISFGSLDGPVGLRPEAACR